MENEQKTGAAAQPKKMDHLPTGKVKEQENADENTFAQDVKETVKKTADKAAGQAKDKAFGLLDEKKHNLTSGINTVADTIRKIGEDLRENDDDNVGKMAASLGSTLAGQIENFSSYVEDAKVKEITRDIENFARRQPMLFVGGAFVIGLLAARFLKTSNPD